MALVIGLTLPAADGRVPLDPRAAQGGDGHPVSHRRRASAWSSPSSSGAGSRTSSASKTTLPIISFLPMMMFAILFGLSMDYEVFILSRIREDYARTGDAQRQRAHRPHQLGPGHHRRRAHHDQRLRRLRPRRRPDHQDVRHRPLRRRAPRRHRRAHDHRACRHDAVRQGRLVAPPLARPDPAQPRHRRRAAHGHPRGRTTSPASTRSPLRRTRRSSEPSAPRLTARRRAPAWRRAVGAPDDASDACPPRRTVLARRLPCSRCEGSPRFTVHPRAMSARPTRAHPRLTGGPTPITRYAVPLREATDPALTGCLASGLAIAARAGLDVAPGAVLTAPAVDALRGSDRPRVTTASQVKQPLKRRIRSSKPCRSAGTWPDEGGSRLSRCARAPSRRPLRSRPTPLQPRPSAPGRSCAASSPPLRARQAGRPRSSSTATPTPHSRASSSG